MSEMTPHATTDPQPGGASLVGNLAVLAGGIVFGAGLVISGMTNPQKVLAFLTIGSDWNPSLLFVLGGAVVTATIGFQFLLPAGHPWFDQQYHMPSNAQIDGPLVYGSLLFGLGWGLAGFCPGPAIVGLFTLDMRAAIFMVAFVVGMLLFEQWAKRQLTLAS